MPKIKRLSLHRDIAAIAIIIALSVPARTGAAQSDYRYVDHYGNEITLPTGVPIYTKDAPGPWAQSEICQPPTVKWRFRKVGLENTRRIDIEYPKREAPVPTDEEKLTGPEAVFLLDKDDLIVGYQRFYAEDTSYSAKMFINGVINYVRVYTLCGEYGMWLEHVRF